MIIVVTSLHLRSVLKLPLLGKHVTAIRKQLDASNCISYKTHGYFVKHYTISVWENGEDIQKFYTSGAHKQSMIEIKDMAKEARTRRLEQDEIPNWKEVKQLLKEGKILTY